MQTCQFFLKLIQEVSRAVSAVKNWANNNYNIQVNLQKREKYVFLRFCKNPKDLITNSIGAVLFQPEYKYLGFNFPTPPTVKNNFRKWQDHLLG